ncbi:MAG: hypothetical protein U1F76_31480 [Candidatus Competibacteraceae bacterium]
MVHLFVERLLEYLRRYSKRDAHILPVRLNLPPEETFTSRQVEQRVRRLFSLNPSESLGTGLETHKRPTPERTRLVLLLDWGVRGAVDTPRIGVKALRAWVEFCTDQLCEQCPSDSRLLSVLAVQSPRERHAGIAERVNSRFDL